MCRDGRLSSLSITTSEFSYSTAKLKTGLTLFNINETTLIRWFKDISRVQEVRTLLQGLDLATVQPCTAQTLPEVYICSTEPPQDIILCNHVYCVSQPFLKLLCSYLTYSQSTMATERMPLAMVDSSHTPGLGYNMEAVPACDANTLHPIITAHTAPGTTASI